MAIKTFKPYTPSRRHMTVSGFEGVDKKAKPERSLVETLKKHAGRNSYGHITVRHHGGGNKRKYRIIDFKRQKVDMFATVERIEYDPNRSANDGYKWNPAVDMIPLLGGKDAADKFWPMLEEEAGGRILGHDLYLYVREKSRVWGMDGEYISAPALDDLECAWGTVQGFLKGAQTDSVPVFCAFDNEEVGSNSPQGAASTILEFTLERICLAMGLDIHLMLAQSFMASADNAHAIHPNHPEYADPCNAPVLGGGVVLKYNASQRYTTAGVSAAIFRKICARAEVPVQAYCNRADIPGGSTLGHISLTHVSVPTADIGLAQLAMHSCYETAAVADVAHLEKAMAALFGSALEVSSDGGCTIR